jgi:methionyl aminopeptidase
MPPSSIIPTHDEAAFDGMRKAGKLTSRLLDYITPFVQEGVTTEKLDQLCEGFIRDNGAIPAPLGYHGFPKSICTSLNHVVCHGIPGARRLVKGDILNIDVSVILEGWYGDSSRMFFIPPIPDRVEHLMRVTQQALHKGIQAVKPGAHFGDIGYAIQSYVESEGFSVVRDFCGHGIGTVFHGPPEVLHFGKPGTGPRIEKGQFFTIEPMINMGKHEVKILPDGWTAVTKDRKPSAQYEHTLGVTEKGCEIFTVSE